jgi:hypothetical protein
MAYTLFDPAADDWTPDRLVKRAPAPSVVPVESQKTDDEIVDEARHLIEERIEELQARLNALGPGIGGRPRARAIVKQVALRYGHTVDDLIGPYRNVSIVAARCEAYYRIRTETTLSYPAIGAVMDRDHTTIMHGVRKHAKLNNLPMPGERATKNA